MDNLETDLDYREQLVRWYELRAQLEVDELCMLAELERLRLPVEVLCDDRCGEPASVVYGRCSLCEACAIARLRVRQRSQPG